jgi:hypothetical protein
VPCEQATSSAEISSVGITCRRARVPSSTLRQSWPESVRCACLGMRMRPLKIASPRSAASQRHV